MKNTAKQIWLLLTPSWLSGLFALAVSLGAVGATVFASDYQGSSLQQQLFSARGGQSTAAALGFRPIAANLASNRLVADLPMFLFWAVVGVVVYFFVSGIWNSFGRAADMHEEMSYVHASKQQLIRVAAGHAALRLGVLAGWLLYLRLFMKLLMPYGLATAQLVRQWRAVDIGYGLLAIAVLTVSLHLHVTWLRLALLRLRAIGGVDPQSDSA